MAEKRIVLSAKDVEVKFRVRQNYLTAIRNVSLDLYEGETFAIVGESGSGKSVFTKTFTGMLESNGRITNGSIMFYGRSATDPTTGEQVENPGIDLVKLVKDKDWEGIRGAKIATVFQDPMTSLNPIRTIGSQIVEVIEKHQKISKQEAKEQAINMMSRVGIPNAADRFDEYPFQYSGGMRQRIVIAIALSCHPEILICDEPTTALDVTIQAQIIKLIKDLQKELGFTTIYITHDLGVVAKVADRVGVMYGGQIVEYGTAEDIFYDPKHPYTWALLSSLPQLGVKGEDLYYITGTPPSLFNKIVGDSFAPRNPKALQIDFVKEPPFFQVSETHFAKTWLLDPRAPELEKPEVIHDLHGKIEQMTGKGGAFYVDDE
ncbi:MAG: ABC transporter ATP-binding protein [Clostridia bacterium]|nr:ABC transporter ATP-binding protein [Clostridia bacterium]